MSLGFKVCGFLCLVGAVFHMVELQEIYRNRGM